MPDATPFGSAAERYVAAGWVGVLPLPAKAKKSPPTGYTGDTGAYPTPVDLDAWRANKAAGNIGLRMGPDVIGIDVDNYGAKTGGDTLAALVAKCGELPPTWISTSRDDGVSGIRFYRLPQPIKLVGSLPGIEIIQRHHRYAVVAPSMHPEGREYYWVDPDGTSDGTYPQVDDLPVLPDRWLEELRADRKTSGQRRAMATGVEVSRAVERAYGAAMMGMRKGTRHDTTMSAVTALLRLEAQNYPGATDALANLEDDFLAAVTSDGSRKETEAQGEWDRMVATANATVSSIPSTIPKWEDSPGAGPEPDPDALGLTSIGAPAPWDQPRALPAPEPPPAFPLDVLPAWAQDHVLAVAEQVQVPVDAVAMLALGSLFAAATGRAVVHVSDSWVEPVCAYLVIALRSGAGKSPAEKYAARWLRTWQRERVAAIQADHDLAMLKVRHARKKLQKAEGSIGEASDLIDAYKEVQAAEEDVPELPRLLADDATPEAVANLLRMHGERLAIVSTEADLFDMLLKGKPGQRANMNVYLKAWAGDSFIRDRKGGSDTGPEYFELDSPLLTVSVAVQPAVLARLQGDDELTSRGFTSRFMFSVPEDLIGRRDQSKRFGAGKIATQAAYDAQASALASRWATWQHPADLHRTPAASRLLEDFLSPIEPRLATGADLERLGEWANKLYASVARYAGLLHLAEGNDPQKPIDGDVMDRAIDLGWYWLGHAVAVLGLAVERVVQQAETILEWAVGQGAEFRLTDCQQNLRRPGEGLDRIADFIEPVELLIDLGWIRPCGQGDWRANVGVRGAKSPAFALWPEAVGKPLRAHVSRVQSFASMGERDLSSSPPTPTTGSIPRDARNTRNPEEAAPVENPPVLDDDPAPSTDWMES